MAVEKERAREKRGKRSRLSGFRKYSTKGESKKNGEKMKLDPTVMRTMSGSDFRMLQAVEKGMAKGYEWVPVPLIASLASLRHGGANKILSTLLRDKLLSHDKKQGYDGYRVTNAGYDILALHHLKTISKLIVALGDKIGTGKESDIYLAMTPKGHQVVLKFHRLGRTSFRNVKKTRDYSVYDANNHRTSHRRGGGVSNGNNNSTNSWLFLSRKSALKEYAFMKALYDVRYPTPQPLGTNRHIVVMTLVRGLPLYQITRNRLSAYQAESIFHQATNLAVRLAKHGLVHCDLNEFNLLVDLSGIQKEALSVDEDPYVRHSGLSVAAETNTPGMLNARGIWERDDIDLQQHRNSGGDDGSDDGDQVPLKPIELLDNGEPKPIVTLIDFPQMVSTEHPNAKELYERDMACLYKFFVHKLTCNIPEEEKSKLCLTWEEVLKQLKDRNEERDDGDGYDADDGGNKDSDGAVEDDTASVCLAKKAQLRLDQELKASGYSVEDSSRDLELYYYKNTSASNPAATVEEAPEGDVDGEDDDGEEADDEKQNGGEVDEAALPAVADDDDVGIDNLDDNVSIVSGATTSSRFILPPDQLANLSREQLQEHARLRVKQQLDNQKKKGKQRGAFRKHNNNKNYVKGKRVLADFGL